MGRTRPTYRNKLEEMRDDYEPYRRALYRRHQDSFDRLWIHARTFQPSGDMALGPDVRYKILVSMLLGQQLEIDLLREELGLDPSEADFDRSW